VQDADIECSDTVANDHHLTQNSNSKAMLG